MYLFICSGTPWVLQSYFFILLSSPTVICVLLGTWSEGRLRTTKNICDFSSICKGHSWFCVLQSAEVFLFYKAPDRNCAQIPPWEVFLRISLWSDCVIPLIQIKQYRTQHPETPITHDADGVSFFSPQFILTCSQQDLTWCDFWFILMGNSSMVHSEFVMVNAVSLLFLQSGETASGNY